MGGLNSGGDRSLGVDTTRLDGGPVKPKQLDRKTSAIWDKLIAEIDPAILRRCDSHQLATLAQLIGHSRTLAAAAIADPHDPKKTRSWLAVCDQVRKLGSAFGLSPADRSRLKIPHAVDENDPFQAWLAEATGAN